MELNDIINLLLKNPNIARPYIWLKEYCLKNNKKNEAESFDKLIKECFDADNSNNNNTSQQ